MESAEEMSVTLYKLINLELAKLLCFPTIINSDLAKLLLSLPISSSICHQNFQLNILYRMVEGGGH